MHHFNTRLRSTVAAAVLTGLMTGFSPVKLAAAEHVVPAEALTERLQAEDKRRADDERVLQQVFATDRARTVLAAAGLDARQASEGVASLSDDDLARLAERARAFQADLAAGALNNQQITYVLIALATAVVILIILAA